MSLDGLRAWISEVERKLAIRTRVGLVLLAIGIGAGAAGIYLALHTADRSATKDELRQLQGGTASEGTSAQLSALESRVDAAQAAAAAAERKATELEAKLNGGAPGGATGAKPQTGEETPPSKAGREAPEAEAGKAAPKVESETEAAGP
jgi:hypothetical protein